jgi:hypothetical protein
MHIILLQLHSCKRMPIRHVELGHQTPRSINLQKQIARITLRHEKHIINIYRTTILTATIRYIKGMHNKAKHYYGQYWSSTCSNHIRISQNTLLELINGEIGIMITS